VAEAIQGMDTVPDIIYDRGTVGQEAMVWVLGQDAIGVAQKVLLIHHRLLSR
jgi:predicted fused transcriptional regulator/phosphomethylpyrimidine kinase